MLCPLVQIIAAEVQIRSQKGFWYLPSFAGVLDASGTDRSGSGFVLFKPQTEQRITD